MRATSIALLMSLAVGLCAIEPVQAADEFPYTAYVRADEVYVRSGPGRDYYPTDKLAKGAEVEVYRHDPGGWLAVRPPEGSYSWVSSRYMKELEKGLGEVTGERVVSRVGSKFSNVRDVIQVRLDKGEQVEILDSHNSGGQTWYKIAAPSGEFRWISDRYVHYEPPHDGVSKPRRRPRRGEDRDRVEPTSYDDEYDEPRVRRRSSARPDRESDREFERDPRRDRDTVRIDEDDRRGTDVRARRRAIDQAPGDYLDAELVAIEQEISTMVAEEPTVWRFYELQQRADLLLDEAATAVERGRVRRVQHKLTRLEDIRRRHQQIGTVLKETDRLSQDLDRRSETERGDRTLPIDLGRPPVADNSRDFDGQGILKPTASRRRNAPSYALVDKDNQVLTFVSAAPGVNLQPYIGKQVGMTGTRGFMPEWKKPHLMVKRITPLESMLR